MIVEFGKYKNKNYNEIYDIDPNYIDWLLKQYWFEKHHSKDYKYCLTFKKDFKTVFNNEFIVYTDGSCPNNGMPGANGGIGIHFSSKNKIKFDDISEQINIDNVTNNIAELLAIKRVLEITKHIDKVKIYTDSKYSINVITKWYDLWVKNGLLSNKKNLDIIIPICNLYKKNNNVELIHIRSHSGKQDIHSIGNSIADKLATNSIRKK
jgi:ribonuclease HI